MFGSILFLITTIIACVILMCVPKKKGRLNGVTWLTVSIVTLICAWVFFAGVFNLAGVKISLFTISAINFIMTGIGVGYIFSRKRLQEYFVKWKDVFIIVLLAVLSVMIAFRRYGIRLDLFAYGSDDSVRHFAYTKDLIATGMITRGKYVMYLLDMVIIKFLDPFIKEANWHRAFMMGDVLLLFLQGSMFWAWVRKFVNGRYSLLACYGFTVMYFLGYPLTNMLYGFEYLGAGVLMITFVLWLFQRIEYKELSFEMVTFLLMLANTSVCLSYTQFAPLVLVSELIFFVIDFKKKRRLFSAHSLLTAIFGFAVPGCLCVRYIAEHYWKKFWPVLLIALAVVAVFMLLACVVVWIQAAKTGRSFGTVFQKDCKFLRQNKKMRFLIGTLVLVAGIVLGYKYVFLNMIQQFVNDDGMILDGSIYREPYSNFLVLIFPLVLYIIQVIRHRKNDVTLWMLLSSVVFSGWMLSCILNGKIGSYYFYKMHFLIWLLLMGTALRLVTMLQGEGRKYITAYFFSVFCYGLIFISGAEKKLVEQHEWLWPESMSSQIFSVYNHNQEMLDFGGNVNKEMQTIYNKVYEISKREDTFIPYFGEELRYLKEYYYYLSGQNPKDHLEELNDKDYPSFNIREELEKRGVEYIFVEKNYNGPYEDYKPEFDVMWTEYENAYGWILKLD